MVKHCGWYDCVSLRVYTCARAFWPKHTMELCGWNCEEFLHVFINCPFLLSALVVYWSARVQRDLQPGHMAQACWRSVAYCFLPLICMDRGLGLAQLPSWGPLFVFAAKAAAAKAWTEHILPWTEQPFCLGAAGLEMGVVGVSLKCLCRGSEGGSQGGISFHGEGWGRGDAQWSRITN